MTGLGRLLRIASVVAIVIVLWTLADFDSLDSLLQSRLGLALLAMQPFVVGGWIVGGIRHALLVAQPGMRKSIGIKAFVLATGLNLFMPARTGEAVKATYLRQHAGVPLHVGASAVVVERLLDLFFVGLLGFVGLIPLFGPAVWGPALGLVCLAVFTAAVLHRFPDSWLQRRTAQAGPLMGKILMVSATIIEVVRSDRFWPAFGLSLLAWLLNLGGAMVFFALQETLDIHFLQVPVVFAATLMGGAIPLLPGGIGSFQAAGVLALSALGHPAGPALALCIALQVGFVALSGIYAGLLLLREKTGVSQLAAHVAASRLEKRRRQR